MNEGSKGHSVSGGRRWPAALAAAVLAAAAPAALADGGADHRAESPAELGVSGSSREHVISKNRLYCYAGTLGSLVTDGAIDYVLSNNHVLAKENNPDYEQLAADGTEIIQPGLLDQGSCTLGTGADAPTVATLSSYVPIAFGKGKNPPENRVDAAVAEVAPGSGYDGSIKDIGYVHGHLSNAELTMGIKVQKSGRTTGHTSGAIEAVNVTVDVKYDSGTARFLNQIRIRGICGTEFSAGGDSGSQILNVPDGGPRLAVGLLFAGGGADTFANTMEDVFTELNGGTATQSLDLFMFGEDPAATANDAGKPIHDASACASDDGGDGGGGRPGGGPGGGGPPGRNAAVDPAGLEIAREVKSRHSNELFGIPGVVGHGVGADANGDAVIEVYVENASRRPTGRSVPSALEGVPVRVIETGVIRAY